MVSGGTFESQLYACWAAAGAGGPVSQRALGRVRAQENPWWVVVGSQMGGGSAGVMMRRGCALHDMHPSGSDVSIHLLPGA